MMLTTKVCGRLAPSKQSSSDNNKRNTAETQASIGQNWKESVEGNNFEEIEDWIQKEEKIQPWDHDMGMQRQSANSQTRFILPPSNYTNKWTPNFNIVYHQFPPQETEQQENAKQYQIAQKMHQQTSHNWSKSIDTEFSNILIEEKASKQYCSPMPYGFDAERSRIIVGDRSITEYIDCTFKQFVNRISETQSRQAQTDNQSRGIKLTKKKHLSK